MRSVVCILPQPEKAYFSIKEIDMEEQTRLPGMKEAAKKAHRNDDYVNLFPRGVYPSGDIDILTNQEHILVIKSYEWGWRVSPRQKQLWFLMTRYGSHPDAPGSVTVACVWGLANAKRELQIYDHQGIGQLYELSRREWREWLRSWWTGKL